MHETGHVRPLSASEIVSIVRNWTAADRGSLATSVGVIVHCLASRPPLQQQLRTLVHGRAHAQTESAIVEILRIDDPFVSNRRRTTREVELLGQEIPRGSLVLIDWVAANRDARVFPDPDAFDPVGNAPKNLVFGIGPHICPGRALTLMELRVIVEELLDRTTWIEPAPDRPTVRETPPSGGWARAPVRLR
jgi:cytochrome P450